MADDTATFSLREVFGSAMPPAFDRYEVRGLLGQGGMGAVYLGFDQKLGREVAIKVIHADQQDDTTLRHRFHREARAVAMLHHPNIIEVLDYSGQDAEALFLVMERLLGQPLDAILRGGVLSEAQGAAVAYELCDALAHAHDKGIIHRDLKPENVFLEPSGRVVLTDFGIAKGIGHQDQKTFAGKGTAMVGTPLFASLEQLTAPERVAAPADLFSLGTVLYHALSNDFPYPADSLPELLNRLKSGDVQPLRERARVSDEMHFLVMRLLEVELERRPRHALEVQRSLRPILERAQIFDLKAPIRAALNGEPTQSERVDSTQLTAPALTAQTTLLHVPLGGDARRPLWLALGLLVLALVLAGVVFMLVRGNDSSTPAKDRPPVVLPPLPPPVQ